MSKRTAKQIEQQRVRSRRHYHKLSAEDCKRKALKTAHNMSLEVWQEMFVEQDGVCAMCGRKDRPLVVDHDHACCPSARSCGRCVRGLICRPCNFFLGRYEGTSGDNARRYLG